MSATAELPPLYDGEDLGTLEFWRQSKREREETFSQLRRELPLSRHKPPADILGLEDQSGIVPYWAIVRYEDIRKVSRTPEVFCSGEGTQFGNAPKEMLEATQSIIAMDAPRHTKVRGLISASFTPRQIARIDEAIRDRARQIIDEAGPTGGGDFVELIAKRLPLMTISDMMGIPEADREAIVTAADTVVTAADPEVAAGRPILEVLGGAIFTLHQFAAELAAFRADNPGDDLMTALVQAEVDGEKLTQDEIAAFFVLLSVAGNDTTRHTTSWSLRALTEHPDQLAYLKEDVAGRLPSAVEEFLRWATPVMTFRRTTTQPVELHGITIPAGEKVVMFYQSGNADETAWDDPWRFDVTRDPNHHLAFGGGGPHFCLGASLARTQLRSIFGEMLTRLGKIEAGEPERFDSGGFIDGVKRMPCTFTATA